jgi:CDGSH-type Zn-finger protein
MTRLIKHSADKPFIHMTPTGDKVAICMCGLSKTYPFCDASHGKTKDESGQLCCYDKEGNRLSSEEWSYQEDKEITNV